MPGTPTPRLNLPLPIGSDSPSELRIAIAGLSTALDGSIPYTTGTLAARPSAPTVSPQVYEATDTGLTYWWDGTAWRTIMLPGAWVPLTLPTNFSAASGYYPPSARQEGDTVRLCGAITNAVTLSGSNNTWATIPTGLRPASAVAMAAAAGAAGVATWNISSAGTLAVNLSSAAGTIMPLDAISYRLN